MPSDFAVVTNTSSDNFSSSTPSVDSNFVTSAPAQVVSSSSAQAADAPVVLSSPVVVPAATNIASPPVADGPVAAQVVANTASSPVVDGLVAVNPIVVPAATNIASSPVADGPVIAPAVVSLASPPVADGPVIAQVAANTASPPVADGPVTVPVVVNPASPPVADGPVIVPTVTNPASPPVADSETCKLNEAVFTYPNGKTKCIPKICTNDKHYVRDSGTENARCVPCPVGRVIINAGTEDAVCIDDIKCSESQLQDSDGKCITLTCPDNYEIKEGGTANAKCVRTKCPQGQVRDGDTCSTSLCKAGYKLDKVNGENVCVPKTCKSTEDLKTVDDKMKCVPKSCESAQKLISLENGDAKCVPLQGACSNKYQYLQLDEDSGDSMCIPTSCGPNEELLFGGTKDAICVVKTCSENYNLIGNGKMRQCVPTQRACSLAFPNQLRLVQKIDDKVKCVPQNCVDLGANYERVENGTDINCVPKSCSDGYILKMLDDQKFSARCVVTSSKCNKNGMKIIEEDGELASCIPTKCDAGYTLTDPDTIYARCIKA